MSSEVPLTNKENSENDQFIDSDNDVKDENTDKEAVLDDSSTAADHIPDNQESIKSQSSQLADNEARLQQLEKEHETLKNQYIRIAADFDNFRKRQTRDNDDLRIQLTCNTLSEILPVVDNFERARQQLNPEGEEAQALHRSYQGLYKQLVDILKKLGVAPMRVEGQSFDPNLHEAVMKEPSDSHNEDIIIEELQRGYHLEGRVIRHALVKVSMGPGPSTQDKQEIEAKNNVEGDEHNLEKNISNNDV